jgi:hypothetical protein
MTAVEWLVQQIDNGKIEIIYSDKIHSIKCLPEFVKQAIEMEKQQICKAFDEGWIYGDGYIDKPAKEYYSETYKSNNP